jgi:hypothetical protein
MRTFTRVPLVYLVRRIKGHGSSLIANSEYASIAEGLNERLARDDYQSSGVLEGLKAGCRLPEPNKNLFSRPCLLFVLVATLVAMTMGVAPAFVAAASEACPNEQVRAESNTDPATGQSYSVGLPECRAYEMVSPLEKQGHDALQETPEITVSPDGTVVGWVSAGDFAGTENYATTIGPWNPYLAQRRPSGWATRSGFAPAALIQHPVLTATEPEWLVPTPDLSSQANCGYEGSGLLCALREPDGSWSSSPIFSNVSGKFLLAAPIVLGASRDLSDLVFQLHGGQRAGEEALLPTDVSSCAECTGIYEISRLGSSSPELRLVDVDNSGHMIGPDSPVTIGAGKDAPGGSTYQAVSDDGEVIYFTATPSGGIPTIYARVAGKETVAVSDPSPAECTTCNSTPAPATYQGASADGTKVFFTTTQQLVDGDVDEDQDLYEYDFANPPGQRLMQVSHGGSGDLTPGEHANVEGVVSVSEDGERVYFVAGGVLTTLPNSLGQIANRGAANLYGYDTETGETKFVADVCSGGTMSGGITDAQCPVVQDATDKDLQGFPVELQSGDVFHRLAQTTPTGQYLVFDTYAKLITSGPEVDTNEAQQVYRYDFQTGYLVRVSVGHNEYGSNGNTPGINALIPQAGDSQSGGGMPSINDVNRAISENGEYIIFVTSEKLQESDLNNASDVYLWHNGMVTMLSAGQDPEGVATAAMSASGGDVFFQTHTRLVGQDTDELGDIYDARVDGGFPAPTPELSCSGEVCQGSQSTAPTFGAPGSQSLAGSGNQFAPPFEEALEPKTKSKSSSLTNVQKLARALKECQKDRAKAKRAVCERTSRKKFAPKLKKKSNKKSK